MVTQKQQHHSPSHMGGGASFKPFIHKFFFFLIITLILIAAQAVDTGETPRPNPNLDDDGEGGNAIGKPPPPPPPAPPPPPVAGKNSAFKPGIAVIVGVLTTMFSLTFLLLLYIKHCNGGGNVDTGGNMHQTSRGHQPFAGRKNSGIDRAVVESLPIFRFGSLRGQKDGLDCAVCLTKFEATEVLRLLPKCKHAFHVECVDTWLDAHSTCPLCRYRVDPEDILLVEDAKILRQNQPIPPPQQNSEQEYLDIERGRISSQLQEARNQEVAIAETRRVSGRHSSVGERDGGFLQIILQTAENGNGEESEYQQKETTTSSFRRSLDSATATARKKSESVGIGIGYFVRPRKDGFLLNQDNVNDKERDRTSIERRLEHRIIVSPSPKSYSNSSNSSGGGGVQYQQRWSDVQPSDLLYLTSEMIISDRRGLYPTRRHGGRRKNGNGSNDEDDVEIEMVVGRGVINLRSVSEITGLSRFMSNNNNNNNNNRNRGMEEQRQREEGVVSRWLAWISKSQAPTAVR